MPVNATPKTPRFSRQFSDRLAGKWQCRRNRFARHGAVSERIGRSDKGRGVGATGAPGVFQPIPQYRHEVDRPGSAFQPPGQSVAGVLFVRTFLPSRWRYWVDLRAAPLRQILNPLARPV